MKRSFPLTICNLKGKIHICLDANTILDISKNKNDFIKCSTRDIAYELMAKKNGITTVAATMLIAYREGIKVFVTGGMEEFIMGMIWILVGICSTQ